MPRLTQSKVCWSCWSFVQKASFKEHKINFHMEFKWNKTLLKLRPLNRNTQNVSILQKKRRRKTFERNKKDMTLTLLLYFFCYYIDSNIPGSPSFADGRPSIASGQLLSNKQVSSFARLHILIPILHEALVTLKSLTVISVSLGVVCFWSYCYYYFNSFVFHYIITNWNFPTIKYRLGTFRRHN